ncbi:MAG: hypothetical protein IPL78_07460 [Chloroflexi bacterium]|nr:hypothetical protein [Chloroflexota bacterium]
MTSTSPASPIITRAEWRFVAFIVLLVLVLTSVPYLFGWLTAPPEKQFMGIMLDVPDHGQYFSWMRELTYANLSANKLTPEPNQPIFFNLLWWGLGRLGNLVGVGYAGMFQVLRVVATALFLPLVYLFCGWFLPERGRRQTAFLLITFSAGLGWLLIVYRELFLDTDLPLRWLLDIFTAEGNTFLSVLGYPHFIGAALYIAIFYLFLRGQEKGQLRYAVYAGLLGLFFGWQHAYDLVLVYGILGAYTLLFWARDRRFPWFLVKGLIILGLISWWPALYSFILTSLDPVWEEVLAQFANAGVYSPPPFHLLIFFGPLLWLAIVGLVRLRPHRLTALDNKTLFLVAWFVANFFLLYIPTDFQVHMLNGWQVPMGVLATLALYEWVAPGVSAAASRFRLSLTPKTVQKAVPILFLLVVIPTNLYLWLWRFDELRRHDYPYYLYQDELDAFAWLEENAASDDVVLSSVTTGQYIPALTGTHAFLAHWAQTLDFFGKTEMVNSFFDPDITDPTRQAILSEFSVDYVLYGPAEQALGTFDPAAASYLTPVFTSSTTQVFQVSPSALAN